ncbi:galactose oxidase [Wallemia mellicola]|nr:galactose oxidase [Wallemia mellicola]
MSDAPTITIGHKAHRPTTARTQGEINVQLTPELVVLQVIVRWDKPTKVTKVSHSQLMTLANLSDLTAYPRSTTGSVPPPLVGPSMTVVNDQLYLIGGRKVTERVMTNNVYKLDLNTLRWDHIQFDNNSDIPSERYFHSVDLWNDYLVLFGGMAYKENDELAVLDDVFYLNLKSLTWKKVETSLSPSFTKPSGPQPRYAHLSSISGDCLVIAGGQGKDNQYIEEIAILDLRSLQWLHSRAYDHQCGSYRSVAISSPQRVVTPDPTTIRVGGEVLHLLPYTDNCTEFDPSDVYLYSNYNFQDLKRELEVLEAPTNTEFTIANQSGLMRGASLPPGLRFPTGSILGNHLIISGTYLANTSQSFSIWALDLTTFVWQRIDAGSHLSSGSWNRGTLWRDTNRYVVMGNRDRSLVTDYNHRQQNFDHIAFVELEAYGVYQPPPVSLSLDAQLLGLQSLSDESLADFELIPEVSNEGDREKYRFLCSSRILEARWPWFRTHKSSYNAQLQAQDPSSIAEQRLLSKTLTIPESPTVVRALLEWFYTSALVTPLQLSQPVLAALLGLSRTYGLESLEKDVKHAMHMELEPATAVQIHEAATLCGARMLQIRALKMVMSSNKRTGQNPIHMANSPGDGPYDTEPRYAQFGTGQGNTPQMHQSGSTGQFSASNSSQYGRQRATAEGEIVDDNEDPSIHLANMLSKFATSDVDLSFNNDSLAKQPQIVERPTSPNADPKRVSRIINLPSVMNLHEQAQPTEPTEDNPPEIPARPSLSPPTVTAPNMRNRRQAAMLTPNEHLRHNRHNGLPQPPPQTQLPSPSLSPALSSPVMSRVGSVTRSRNSPMLRSPTMPVVPDEAEFSPPVSPRPFTNYYNYSPQTLSESSDVSRAPSRQGGSNVGLGIQEVANDHDSPALSASTFPTIDGPPTPQDFEMLSTGQQNNDDKSTEQTSSTGSLERARSYSQFSSTAPSVAATSMTTSGASSNDGSVSKRNKLFSKFKSKDKQSSEITRTSNSSSHSASPKEPTPSINSSTSSGQKSMSSGYFSQESKEARKIRKEKEKVLQRQRVEAQRLKAMKRDGKVSRIDF